MTDPVLVIDNLSVVLSRDGRPNRVLDGISFNAAPGEIIALVGESGGQIDDWLALQGQLPRESEAKIRGSIRVAGVEIVGGSASTLRSGRRRLVRAVSQDPMGAPIRR